MPRTRLTVRGVSGVEILRAVTDNEGVKMFPCAVNSTVIVADALREPSPEHCEVIERTYLRDRTINEAAEILGIPPGTVKSRLYYGIRALRKVLKERGVAS
jgi:DNA-directed RNA polymerase specialized sigma24 family protein